jgi:hypothetical protein
VRAPVDQHARIADTYESIINYRPATVVALVSGAAATPAPISGLLLLLLHRGRRERTILSELIKYAQATPRAT